VVLDAIVAHKRVEVATAKRAVPVESLASRAADQPPPLDFIGALRRSTVAVIAEIKRASPSKGVFAPGLAADMTARQYVHGGAAAISVLTDERYFHGTLDDLTAAQNAVRSLQAPVPLLRKDFVIDAYQVVEARAAGADAVLLIVRILSDEELETLHRTADAQGMAALVEVCNAEDIARIASLAPRLVGINQRNLSDFTVDRSTFARLRGLLPEETIVVAASGIRTADDVANAARAGADAILVGEAIVTAEDRCRKVQELSGTPRRQTGAGTPTGGTG